VLVEGKARDGVRLLGKTRDNRTAIFPGDQALIGTRVAVDIARGDIAGLYGEPA